MATNRQSSQRPKRSSKRFPSNGRRSTSTDPFAELHAYRRLLAARFNYDMGKIIKYVESQALPAGFTVVHIPARKRRP